MPFLRTFLLSCLRDLFDLLKLVWRLLVWIERRLLSAFRRLHHLEQRIVTVERRVHGHLHKLAFLWRWLRFVVYRFHLLPPWAKLLKLLLLTALIFSPEIINYLERYHESQKLYARFYPHFYAEYVKKVPDERARYYANFYAHYYADYYTSTQYRVALQYALPPSTAENTSYSPDAANAPLDLTADDLAVIKRFEGLIREPYVDAGGKLTIGYGHLIRPTELYTALSDEEAEQLLRRDVQVAEAEVKRLVRARLTHNQYAALVSLVYNIGSRHFAESTLLKTLNDGNLEEAADQFLRWDNVKGVPLPGLTHRRITERALFLS